MCTRTQKLAANHRVWFHFCQTVCLLVRGCATEVVMSSRLLWLHTGGWRTVLTVPINWHSANQLALEHRETGRFKSRTRALKAFLFRYVILNTFTVCRLQGLTPKKKSLWDFEWDILGNSIAFGKSTSQRIYPEQRTPKIGWKLHKCSLKHALHTLGGDFR